MPLRRAATWISTLVVAIVVAFAVPVSQLRTVTIVKSCCCPDPGDCHCPDHKTAPSSEPSMRSCHNTERAIVAPQLPAFHEPALALALTPAITERPIERALAVPHHPPTPRRPDAPS